MIKKLIKFGNSLALVLDKPILDLLQISDKVELIINERNLIISRPRKKTKSLIDNCNNCILKSKVTNI